MEAARTLTTLPERMRRRRFTAALEELRPLGIAYVLRRFGGSLDSADAEDVVAEVIIRFHRAEEAGRPPERLRPAFFQSCRNAGLDLLRYRGVRPTAPLEVAEREIAEAPGPEERAESRENVVRLREAMARMRPNYREAIVLRFGLGLTVPEIAEWVGISLPAAKKLVLRSTAQIRERMEAIEGRRFCAEMREIAERSVIDGELAGVAEEAEAAAIRAHLEHCGACRGFLAALRSNLHELGAGVLLGGLATGKLGLVARLLSGVHHASDAAQSGMARARLATYRAGGAFRPEGADSAGLLAGTGQKIAAACTAGAAGAGACLATGIVGPGLAVAPHHHVGHHPLTPPAHVREAGAPSGRTHRLPVGEPVTSAGTGSTIAGPTPASAPRPRSPVKKTGRRGRQKTKKRPRNAERQTQTASATASQTTESQFGIEAESSAPSTGSPPPEAGAPVAEARTVETSPPPGSSSGSTASSTAPKSSSGGHEEFGFGG